jgi:hypothetical protein
MFEIRLRELCTLLLDPEEAAKIDCASECAKHEDLTTDAFISHEHNGLFDLIGKTKSAVEESIANMRLQQHELLLKAEEGSRQLTLSAEIKDQVSRLWCFCCLLSLCLMLAVFSWRRSTD